MPSVLALAMGLAIAAGPARAQVPPPSHPAPTGHSSPAGHEAAHDEHFHRNELAVIVAATYEEGLHGAEGRHYFTVGGEYERRLTHAIGVGAEVEYLADADAWLFLAPVTFHPVGGLKVFGGLGLERKAVHEGEHGGHHEGVSAEGGRESFFLWRIGAAYAVEFAGRYSIGPTVSLDFVRESGAWVNAVVYGVAFGVAF